MPLSHPLPDAVPTALPECQTALVPHGTAEGEPTEDHQVLLRLRDVVWLPVPNVVESASGPLPRDVRATSAVLLDRDAQHQVLLTRVAARGWDVPGGHVELGETSQQAATREVSEETGLVLSPTALRPAGHVRLRVQAARPAGYRYPYPDSCMVAWSAGVGQVSPPVLPSEGSECVDAAWFSMHDAREHLKGGPWWPLLKHQGNHPDGQ